jgi:oxygen-dependent protoporphyrinogen oxidase
VEALPRALATRLGRRLRLGTEVLQVQRDREGGFRVAVRQPGGTGEMRACAIVLATPAYASSRMVAGLSTSAALASASIPYAPVTMVHLGYSRAAFRGALDAFAFQIPRERSRVMDAFFSATVCSGRTPNGSLLLSVPIGGARRPALTLLPDRRLAELVHADLAQLLVPGELPQFSRVVRHPRAIPRYTAGHAGRLAALADAESTLPGLFFAGNAYHGPGMADCIRNGAPVAERVATFLGGGC